MTTVNTTQSNGNSINTALISSLGLNSGATTQTASPALTQQNFLTLLTAQLQYQDPTKPASPTDFVNQMAQLSEVSGIQSMQSSITQLASSLQSNQSLQAAALVGRSVLVPGSSMVLGAAGASVQGAVGVPASGNVVVNVINAAGQVVRQINLGTQAAGMVNFSWNGQDASGNPLPAGGYSINATVGAPGQTQAAATYVAGLVNSVALTGSTLTLNVQGQGAVPFSQVQQIM